MQQIQPYSGKLSKFYRQPKVFISLPSKGEFYPAGVIDGDIANLPVFGMNAMDELMFKNPDALFSGEAVVSVIHSCIPAIKDPWQLSQLDIESVLVGIRMATYGDALDISFKCNKCKSEQSREFNLLSALEYFNSISYSSSVTVEPLTFYIRPLTYREANNLQLQAYRLQKTLQSQTGKDDEEQLKKLDEFYRMFGKLQSENLVKQIASVEADGEVVSNQQEIADFIKNSEHTYYEALTKHIESTKEVWKIPAQKVQCDDCEHEQEVGITLDASIFFGNK